MISLEEFNMSPEQYTTIKMPEFSQLRLHISLTQSPRVFLLPAFTDQCLLLLHSKVIYLLSDSVSEATLVLCYLNSSP